MKDDKLIRGDAKLKKLPEDRQREIWERLNAPGETLAKVAAWLREDGISVSGQTLSEFYSWFAWKEKMRVAEANTQNFQELIAQRMPELSKEKVAEFASIHFQLEAVRKDQPDIVLAFQTAEHRAKMDVLNFEQRNQRLAFDKEKFENEVRADIDKGLDALYAEVKGHPEALELFNRFRAVITKKAA